MAGSVISLPLLSRMIIRSAEWGLRKEKGTGGAAFDAGKGKDVREVVFDAVWSATTKNIRNPPSAMITQVTAAMGIAGLAVLGATVDAGAALFREAWYPHRGQ